MTPTIWEYASYTFKYVWVRWGQLLLKELGNLTKVHVAKSNTTFISTPILEWFMVRGGSKNIHQKHVFKSDWITCSIYTNHSRFNSQHGRGGGDLHDHLMSMGILTLRTNKTLMWLWKLYGKWLHAWFGFATHLARVARFKSYKKWVHIQTYPSKAHLSHSTRACDSIITLNYMCSQLHYLIPIVPHTKQYRVK